MRPDVARYSRVAARFWSDERVVEWSDETKLCALYIMTCRHRTLEGIYVLPPSYAAADLRWPIAKTSRALRRLITNGFVRFDWTHSVVLIRNALVYQAPESANVILGAIRRILDLPRTALIKEFMKLAQLHLYRKGAPALGQAFYVQLEQALERQCERQSQRPIERPSTQASEPTSELLTSDLNLDRNRNQNLNLESSAPRQTSTNGNGSQRIKELGMRVGSRNRA